MRLSAQDEAAKAKLAEAEAAVADIKARVDAHDEQTKRLHDVLEERTTEHGAANKPLKVRLPATLSFSGTPALQSIARRLHFVMLLCPR